MNSSIVLWGTQLAWCVMSFADVFQSAQRSERSQWVWLCSGLNSLFLLWLGPWTKEYFALGSDWFSKAQEGKCPCYILLYSWLLTIVSVFIFWYTEISTPQPLCQFFNWAGKLTGRSGGGVILVSHGTLLIRCADNTLISCTGAAAWTCTIHI